MTNRQRQLMESILHLMEELDRDLMEAMAEDLLDCQHDIDPKHAAFFANAKT